MIIISKEKYREMLMYKTPMITQVNEVSFIGKLLGRKPKIVSSGGNKHHIIEAICFNPITERFEVFGEELIIK